jgi:hypothetical protein
MKPVYLSHTHSLIHSRALLVGEVPPEATVPTMQLSALSKNTTSPCTHYKIQCKITWYCVNIHFPSVQHQKTQGMDV